MELNVNKEVLNFVFRRLRMQEGIKEGKLTMAMDSETIFKILFNVKFKQERGMVLTELEKGVNSEVGSYIRTYVAQKWEEAKSKNTFLDIPFAGLEKKTASELANSV